MDFFAFERAALRLKEILGIQTDKDLAFLLAMDVSAFNKRKTRGSFPEEHLRVLAAKRPDLGIDLEYVLKGPAARIGREGVTSEAAHAYLAQREEDDFVAARRVAELADSQRKVTPPNEQRRLQESHAAQPVTEATDEALLLAAFRAADAQGRAAVLLAAQGIAALAKDRRDASNDEEV